jgi:hypothetical protein
MSDIHQLFMQRYLNKLVNCYCADCVGYTENIPTAPKLIELDDHCSESCLCADCMKFNIDIIESHPIIEFKEINTTSLTCMCFNCVYECIANTFLDDMDMNIYKKVKKLGWKFNYNICGINIIEKKGVRIGVYEFKKYTYSDDYCWIHLESDDFLYADLFQNYDFVKKICYYKEYRGFKLNYGDDEYEDEIIDVSSPCQDDSLANRIIVYRSFCNDDISFRELSNEERQEYYSIIDQYCYECNKYKGACLGHEYPDQDEFKYVIKNKLKKESDSGEFDCGDSDFEEL